MRPTFCLFAKPPVAGHTKTRLGLSIGHEAAATLASAFVIDTWNSLMELGWADTMLSSPAVGEFPIAAEPWLQCEGDLGAKLEHSLREALSRSEYAFAIGADSPGMPPELFEEAREAMNTHDAVLGPTSDGGFYLLGLARCPPGLLADLPWSTEATHHDTLQRLNRLGFRVAELTEWWDVDDLADLPTLRAHLAAHPHLAPATQAALAALQWPE